MPFRFPCIVALLLSAFSAPLPAKDSRQSSAAGGGSAEASPEYVLQPYDLIKLEVFQEPDLERQVRLSQDSVVTLPLVGTIDLKGKNVREAQRLICEFYDRDYLVNPQINITVLEYAKETVTVLGAVNTAGAILIPQDQTLNLLDAIGRAGGFSRLADRKHIKLTRVSDDGKTSTTVVNGNDIIQSASGQRALQKGDVIFVTERIL